METLAKYAGALNTETFLKIINSEKGWMQCLRCNIPNGECVDLAHEGRCITYDYMKDKINAVELQMQMKG